VKKAHSFSLLNFYLGFTGEMLSKKGHLRFVNENASKVSPFVFIGPGQKPFGVQKKEHKMAFHLNCVQPPKFP